MKRKYIRNKNFCIGLGIVVFLFVMMFISLFYTPYPPDAMDTANAFACLLYTSFCKRQLQEM